MIFSFYLNDAVPVDTDKNLVVYGILGHPCFLPYSFKEMPADVTWLKGAYRLAQIKDNGRNKSNAGYTIFANGTLMINNLTEENAGTNYLMRAFNHDGMEILKQKFTLVVQEFLRPQLLDNCSGKILTCEVTYKKPPPPKLVLLFNNQQVNNIGGPFYTNESVTLNYTLKTHSGNFICEASNNASTQRVKKEINCSDPTGNMFFYLIIGGSIVVFIIILAVLIYCIRWKRAKRRELEAEERELQTRIAVENGLKYRKLPQPPVRGASNQPLQPLKPPPLHSEVPQQAGPPQPRPRPHQKPPRHVREKL